MIAADCDTEARGGDGRQTTADTLVAVVQLVHPGAGCMLMQMLTDPIAIVRVAGANHSVRFVDDLVHRAPGKC